MSRTVRTFGQHIRTTVDLRPDRSGEALIPLAAPRPSHAVAKDLEALAVDTFSVLVDDSTKKLGEPRFLTERERKATRARLDRCSKRIKDAGPDGPRMLVEARWQATAGAPAATLLARAKPEVRRSIEPALREGFLKGTTTIVEHGLGGRTAQSLAITHGLLSSIGMHALGDGISGGTDVLAQRRSATTSEGVHGHVDVAAFGTSSGAALALLKASLNFLEMAFRSESRWREEEKARDRIRQDREWAAAREARAVLEAGADEDQDATSPSSPAGPEEHGAMPMNELAASGSIVGIADDLRMGTAPRGAVHEHAEPDEDEPVCPPEDMPVWDATRHRMIPASIASEPKITGAHGPEGVRRRADQDERIRQWEQRMRALTIAAGRRQKR